VILFILILKTMIEASFERDFLGITST